MADSFSAAVADWSKRTVIAQTAVLQTSLRLLDEEVVATVPVVSGNLRNSRTVSPLGRPSIEWRTKKFRDPSDAINNAIAGVEVGQTAYYGFRAPYAYRVEKARGFFRLVAQRWKEIVGEAARSVAGRST
jgi:hypothetical protein